MQASGPFDGGSCDTGPLSYTLESRSSSHRSKSERADLTEIRVAAGFTG
jgi:hypothetical protein